MEPNESPGGGRLSPSKVVSVLGSIIGGATGLGALLLGFGFFSHSAQYGFAGLPLLSVDYSGLTEAGASAIVKSLSVLSEGWARKLALVAIFLTGAALWLLQDRWHRLHRFLRRPDACLLVQAALLGLLVLALLGMVPITLLADSRERTRINQETLKDLADLRASKTWDLVKEDQVIARRTYPARGLFRPVALGFRDRQAEDFLDSARSGAPSTGYPLRRAQADRDNARNLYGWIFLSIIVLGTLVILSWRWHRELELAWEELPRLGGAEAEARLRTMGYQPGHALQLVRWLVLPLLGLSLLTGIALVPLTQGILLTSVIGEERVMVRLAERDACYGEVKERREEEQGKVKAGGRDQAALISLLKQLRGGDSAEPYRPKDPLRHCSDAEAKQALVKARMAFEALRALFQDRREALGYEEKVDAYARALDDLVSWTKTTGCLQGLEQFELQKPPPNIFLLLPEASERYLSRWIDLQHHFGRTRSGYILRYPRGEERKSLTLFDPLMDPGPAANARWLVHAIPSECIDELVVAPDNVADELARLGRLYDGTLETQRFLERLIQFHPKALAVMLRLLRGGLSVPHRGVIITALGTVAGALKNAEPEAAQLVADQLHGALVNESLPADARGAAATALHVLGGPEAAMLLGRAVSSPERLPHAVLGTATTAAGYLIDDAIRWQRELDPRAAHEGEDHPLPAQAQDLYQFLIWVIGNAQLSSQMRGTAATALGNARLRQAGDVVLAAAQTALSKDDWTILGPSLIALGSVRWEGARPLLRTVASEGRVPARVRGGAVVSLYSLGLYGESDTILPLAWGAETTDLVRGTVLQFIEDLDPRAAAPLSLACAADAARPSRTRAGCLLALSLIADTERGDEGLAQEIFTLVQRWQETPPRRKRSDEALLLEQACYALAELEARNGHAVDVIFSQNTGLCQAERADLKKHPTGRGAHHLDRAKKLFGLP